MNEFYEILPVDTAELEAGLIADYEQRAGQACHPASPERLIIAWVTAALAQVYAQINNAANQCVPSRATGENLDALGELFGNFARPEPCAAIVPMNFTIAASQGTDIVIPAGTRVSNATGDIIFMTNYAATIQAGLVSSGLVYATCTTVGTAGNGYAQGQISRMLDDITGVSCSNSAASYNGRDEMSDEDYRVYLRECMASYTSAGSRLSYERLAKSASSDIIDVRAVQPRGTKTVTLTFYDGNAFMGADGIESEDISITGSVLGTDYTLSSENGCWRIEAVSGGNLDGQNSVTVSYQYTMAGYVYIYALSQGNGHGVPASTYQQDLILAACNADDARPMTDRVFVKTGDAVSLSVVFTYYVYKDCPQSETEIRAIVDRTVADYVEWQCAKFGRDINPSKLIQMLMDTGVIKRVNLTSPTFVPLGDDDAVPKYAYPNTITVTYGGIEDA